MYTNLFFFFINAADIPATQWKQAHECIKQLGILPLSLPTLRVLHKLRLRDSSAKKGYLFQTLGIWKGRDSTSWSIWKGRKFVIILSKKPKKGPGEGVLLDFFEWGYAAGTLEALAYTRASLSEFYYPILD